MAGLAMIWFSGGVTSTVQGRLSGSRLSGLPYGTVLLPFTFAVLSATYILPSELRDCRTEMYWDHLFRSKNEAVIRSIQSHLHCCGFNSMRDRAWPFPSRSNDARTCQTTSGFHTHCGPLWKQQVLLLASISGIASILNASLLVCNSKAHLPYAADVFVASDCVDNGDTFKN